MLVEISTKRYSYIAQNCYHRRGRRLFDCDFKIREGKSKIVSAVDATGMDEKFGEGSCRKIDCFEPLNGRKVVKIRHGSTSSQLP